MEQRIFKSKNWQRCQLIDKIDKDYISNNKIDFKIDSCNRFINVYTKTSALQIRCDERNKKMNFSFKD